MKLLFLCGSLEPGKDGVGDYTRRLAAEFIRRGHVAAIVALNDWHVTGVEQSEQESEGTAIPVLRLPAVLSNKEKPGRAEKWIREFRPDLLSLQYVPHAYNKRGLAWLVLRLLGKIKKQGIEFCVTVHEPFVRMDDSKNPVHVFIALLQRVILWKILRAGSFVMTSMSHYGRLLNGYNKNIVINRIPPNIVPVSVAPEILKCKRDEYLKKMNATRLIVIFGDRNTDSMIAAVERMNGGNREQTGVLIVGKTAKRSIDRQFVCCTGILSEAEVSCHLQIADLFVLPERVYKNSRGGASFKSGSLAAALATPLPVMTSLGDMTETPPLIHGENIWFTDFNDRERLMSDTLYLLHHPVVLNQLKLGARQLYSEYLHWNVVIDRYSELLRSNIN